MPEPAYSNPNEAISKFFEKVRHDSGIQAQLNATLASTAPAEVAKIAHDHGFEFSKEDLTRIIKDRAQTSLQGEVFWATITQKVFPRVQGEPFVQIKGPSWVQTQPYRRDLNATPESSTCSLTDLLGKIASST